MITRMKIPFTNRIFIFFSIIFLCVIVIAIITYKNGRTFRESSASVDHTGEVLRESEQILSLAKDLNGGGRGYVATGDSSYLEYFILSKNVIFDHVEKLRSLSDDGQEQLAKIDSLADLIHKRIDLSYQIIKLKNENHIREANILIDAKLGRFYMDKIRLIISELKYNESSLLEHRKATYNKSISVASFIFFLLCITLIILLVISYFVIRYHFNRREKAEKRIKESEQMFSSLFYKSPVMKAISEISTGKYIEVNDAFANFFGYPKEEMVGKTAEDLHLLDDPGQRVKIIEHIKQVGFVRELELKFYSQIKKTRWVSTDVDIIDLNGRECFLSAGVDITKRKEAEESLAKLNNELEQRVKDRTEEVLKSEKKYRHLFENNPMPMWVIDLSTYKFLDVNEAALVHYGYSRAEFLAMNAVDIRPDEDKRRFREFSHHPQYFNVSDYNRGIWQHLKKDGTIIHAEVFAHEIFFEGKTARLILANDITEKVKAEEKIKTLNESLEKKVEERTAQLKEVNRELEAFSYSVSHDLRAPLRIIDGYANILIKDNGKQLDSEGQRMLGNVMANAQRMGHLIDDLLNFSRLGRKELEIRSTDMNEIVQAIVHEQATVPLRHTIHLKKLMASSCDSHLISQVWSNLISNAIKYSSTKENPSVEIGSEKNGSEIIYYVKDNGVGFDMRYADKLFGVFQRLHGISEFEGTGVGLAIVQRIISKHNGKVWAEGEVDKGATFFFTLPK
jgi:PAS domain S-box-containing protein